MNYNTYIFYDFETGSRSAFKTQPIQLAAVAIDGRKMEIIDGSEFNTLIRPISDEEAIAKGLDPISDEALKINKKTREELKDAPVLKVAWTNFVNYVNGYNYKKDKWNAPIPVGYNNNGFDDIIIQRLATEFNNIDTEYGKVNVFHPIHNQDLMKLLFQWVYENDPEVRSLSMDSMRTYFGLDLDGAHDALVDVKQGAMIFCRFMKYIRKVSSAHKFKNSFKKEVNV